MEILIQRMKISVLRLELKQVVGKDKINKLINNNYNNNNKKKINKEDAVELIIYSIY